MIIKQHNKKYLKGDAKSSFWLLKRLTMVLFICTVMGCDDYLHVDLPDNQLTSETVFKDKSTATAALRGIYSDLRDKAMGPTLGSNMGAYTDELDVFNQQEEQEDTFYSHTVLASDTNVSSLWGAAYNIIYEANAVIEGVKNSTSISQEDQDQLVGEALFIRGYMHFLLVELFGPIPYIATTDYNTNKTASRMPVDEVYNHIIVDDLTEASNLLNQDVSGERIRAYDAVVNALLARVYLYRGEWEKAEENADKVISAFVLELDLDKVFLKEASGTIWQFKPEEEGDITREADLFIFLDSPGVKPVLSASLLDAFSERTTFVKPDLRQRKWTRKGSGSSFYHAYKYKETDPTTTSLEYSVVFRLAEQYLIRAEARAQQGDDIAGAQADLNVIRSRAGLENTTANTVEDLIDAILHERRVEFFTEYGHRWFDLKRMEKAAEVLGPIKSGWRDTDILLPIPENELLVNPNLLPQNNGY